MKIGTRKIEGPKTAILALPRPSKFEKDSDGKEVEVNQDIILHATAVLDYSDFEALCPIPKPPRSKKANGPEFDNVEHPDYKLAIAEWSHKRVNWLILQSYSATPDLTWDTVNMQDATTWANWRTELREAGFNPIEIRYFENTALDVNSVDEEKLEEARLRFLASKAQQPEV